MKEVARHSQDWQRPVCWFLGWDVAKEELDFTEEKGVIAEI